MQTCLSKWASYGLMAILLHPYLPSKINRLRLPMPETPNRMHSLLRLRPRGRVLRGLCGPALMAAALAAAGCGNDPVTNPDQTPPTAVTETFEETLTVHGAITHPIVVQTAGTVTSTLTALDPPEAFLNADESWVGMSLGTWNGIVCTVGAPTLANDKTAVGVTLTGSATATGNYCVRVYDVGKLKQPVAFQLTITHF
jgi:hypothetical protein